MTAGVDFAQCIILLKLLPLPLSFYMVINIVSFTRLSFSTECSSYYPNVVVTEVTD